MDRVKNWILTRPCEGIMGGKGEQEEQESGPGAGSGRERMLARGVNALNMWFPRLLRNPRWEEGTLQQEEKEGALEG